MTSFSTQAQRWRATDWSDREKALAQHLVASRLVAAVDTSPASTLSNCQRLVDGDPDYTFGLSDWESATSEEALDAVRALFGGDPAQAAPDDAGWIEPSSAIAGIRRHRDALRTAARDRLRVLFATGHPTGLLGHYAALARVLQQHGCALLAPLDDRYLGEGEDGRRRGIRFIDGVACAYDGGSLRHTHRSGYMEAMLDALGGGPDDVDLVVADHGMAGTALERGIPTLSIADVNDPALPLAQVRGRTGDVLPIDDNLAPRLFVPVTSAMLDWP